MVSNFKTDDDAPTDAERAALINELLEPEGGATHAPKLLAELVRLRASVEADPTNVQLRDALERKSLRLAIVFERSGKPQLAARVRRLAEDLDKP
jgi:hypothetical protein